MSYQRGLKKRSSPHFAGKEELGKGHKQADLREFAKEQAFFTHRLLLVHTFWDVGFFQCYLRQLHTIPSLEISTPQATMNLVSE